MNVKTNDVWYDLGPVSAIPVGEGRSFRLGEVAVAVFRTRDGGVFATQAACPHRAGPLADGIVGDGQVICPLHAYAFNLPSGASRSSACAGLTTYPVSVDETGHLHVRLTELRAAQPAGSR